MTKARKTISDVDRSLAHIRRQQQLANITGDYRLALAPDPEWPYNREAPPKPRKQRKDGPQTVRTKAVMRDLYEDGIAPAGRSYAKVHADIMAKWPKKWGPPPSEDTVTVVVKKQWGIK
jgi:hypothetical protein